jgi:hypothetical protein
MRTWLGAIVHGATSIEARDVGGYKAVIVKTSVDGETFEFGSEALSDGTRCVVN